MNLFDIECLVGDNLHKKNYDTYRNVNEKVLYLIPYLLFYKYGMKPDGNYLGKYDYLNGNINLEDSKVEEIVTSMRKELIAKRRNIIPVLKQFNLYPNNMKDVINLFIEKFNPYFGAKKRLSKNELAIEALYWYDRHYQSIQDLAPFKLDFTDK